MFSRFDDSVRELGPDMGPPEPPRPNAASVVATLAVMVVAQDRLLFGAHWLTDVVGSMFLATMIIAAALAINTLSIEKPNS